MDAFRPQDMMVKETLKSGITTVLVVPGSGIKNKILIGKET